MHIGNYLRSVMESQRYSVADIAKMVNKTETAVRKDFAKRELHMSVLDAFGKALNFNVYEVLAQNWEGQRVEEPTYEYQKPAPKAVEVPQQTEAISITFQVDSSKKEQLIALLTS